MKNFYKIEKENFSQMIKDHYKTLPFFITFEIGDSPNE